MKNRELHYLLAGRIFHALFAIACLKIITSFLSQTEVGHYYLLNSFISWVGLVLINPIGMYYNRHLHPWQKQKNLTSSFKALNKYLVFVALLIAPLLFAIKSLTGIAASISTVTLLAIVCLYTYVGSWFQTLCPSLNMFGKRKEFVSYTFLAEIVGLLIALILILYVSAGSSYWLLGILVGQMVGAVLSLRYFSRHIFIHETQQKNVSFFTSDLFLFSFPVMLATLCMWAQSQGFRLIVEASWGSNVLAYLSVGLGLSLSASAGIETITTQYLSPSFFSEISSIDSFGRALAWEKMWQKAVIVYIPVMLFAASAADVLLRLLTAPQYYEAARLVKWGCFIEIMRLFTNLLYLISHSEKKTRKAIAPYFIGAVFIICGVFSIKNKDAGFSLTYIPIILAFGSFLTFVTTYFSMKSLIRFRLNTKLISKLLLMSIPMIIFIFQPYSLNPIAKFIICIFLGLYTLWLIRFELKRLSI